MSWVVPLLGKEARFKARLSAKDSGGQQRGVPPPPLLFYLALTRSSMHCFAVRSLVHKVLGVVLLMWYIRYVTETRSTSAWLADMLFVFFFERKKRCLHNRTVCTHKHRHPPALCEQGFLPENIACLSV